MVDQNIRATSCAFSSWVTTLFLTCTHLYSTHLTNSAKATCVVSTPAMRQRKSTRAA